MYIMTNIGTSDYGEDLLLLLFYIFIIIISSFMPLVSILYLFFYVAPKTNLSTLVS